MRTELLEVGARVLVRENYGFSGCRHKPGTVSRKTPKGIVTITVDAYAPHGTIAHDLVFNADGRERGQGYRGRSLEPFSQDVLKGEIYEARIAKQRSRMEDYRMWRTLPDAVIEKVAAILDEAKP